jgi:6-phosphogluconolactonase (cycloisomerase 2 family)
MRFNNIRIIRSTLYLVSILLAACGGGGGGGTDTGTATGTTSYTVGGTVSGLVGSVVLQENISGNNLTITTDGTYSFSVQVASGISYAYNITVLAQPAGQTCNISDGSGIISGNVSNISVSCSNNPYTVGGTVTGLNGSVNLVLQDNNNNVDNTTITADDKFTFATRIDNGNTYKVTVSAQPSGETCSVSNGAGTVSGGNVTNVTVVCSATKYTVGGMVSGLAGNMVLQDNNGDDLPIAVDGLFTFVTPVADGSPYSVTVLTQPAGQSCSVAYGTGTIAAASVTNVAVNCMANTHTIGGTVTGLSGNMVLQDNGADDLTVSVNGPFTFPTAVADNTTYDVTLHSLQFPEQACTITGGSGTATANVTTVVVNCTPTRFAYVANNGSDTVSAYTVDAATGTLTSVGTPVATGNLPFSVTVDPSGKFVYVANNGSDDVSAYTIDSTGALTPIICSGTCSGNNFPAGTGPQSVSVDPTGKYAYVANFNSNDVSAYTIASTGALSPIICGTCSGNNFPAGSFPFSVTVDPTGKFVYVANQGDKVSPGTVSAYTIDSTGALTSVSPDVSAGVAPGSVIVTVDSLGNEFAYVANWGSDDVSAYSIDSTGALTQIPCGGVAGCGATIPANFAAGSLPNSVTVDPSGKFAYVANHDSNDVWTYAIDSTGALSSVGAPVLAGTHPYSVTVDPSGMFVYVANEGDDTNPSDVSAYTIDAGTGALTPIICSGTCSGNNFPAGISPFSVTTTTHLP